MANRFIQIKSIAGEPVNAGHTRLTPIVRSVHLKIPGMAVGLAWDKAVAVLAETDGQEERLPIRDVTRRIEWSLYGAVLVTALFLWLVRRR